jgi:hypothetical protein
MGRNLVAVIQAIREDFGLRWQPAEAKRSEDWSAAATPLFNYRQRFASRRSPKRLGCG